MPRQLRDDRFYWACVRLKFFDAEIFWHKHKDKFVFVYDHESWERRVIAPFILNLLTRWGWVAKFNLRLPYPGERASVAIKRKVDWASDPVCMLWTRERSVLLAANQTIPRLLSACPSHRFDSAVPALPNHLDAANNKIWCFSVLFCVPVRWSVCIHGFWT
jgi:hypothetical protein